MKTLLLVLAAHLALACVPPQGAGPSPAHATQSSSEVQRLARELGEAWGRRDVAALDRLLASEYVHTDVTGAVLGRAAWLEQVRARTTTFAVDVDDVTVTPMRDAVLLTGRNRITGAKGVLLELRFTQTWIQEGGVWRRRAFQATPVTSPMEIAPASASVAEAEVRAASAALADVIKRRDVVAAERILGEEYSLMAPGIGEMPRAKWLASLPEYVVHSFEFSDVQLHVYGTTAVMRSRYKQEATVFGKDRSGALLITDVWVKRDGRWQIVARHTSLL